MDITSDENTVKITPKTWIRKRIWREINDILRLYDFEWISFERAGFWLQTTPKSPDELNN